MYESSEDSFRYVSGPVAFTDLARADLTIDQVYLGGSHATIAADPLAKVLPVGNQGGFRYAGSPERDTLRLVALYTSGGNEDWPDALDPATGVFTYYGDNRKPAHKLHDTPRGGNRILRNAFELAHGNEQARSCVAPFLLFERIPNAGRDIRFRGLLVPGTPLLPPDEQLVAVWRNRAGDRFQNYRAIFTVLDVGTVTRGWLTSVLAGRPAEESPPRVWSDWVKTGIPKALLAPPTTQHRTRAMQLPAKGSTDLVLLTTLWAHFKGRDTDFEACAADLFRLSAPAVNRLETTRPVRDGGRDGIGSYAIGPTADPINLEFALEAKCWKPGTGVGVHDLSRLISRIKHREFGVLVTTSFLGDQAYKEVRADQHPIIVLCGQDLVHILKQANLTTVASVQAWLDDRYPPKPN